MLLKEARDGFLFDCECRHLAKGSIRNYRAETKFLMEFLELNQITEVEDVKAHHIRDFMKQKQDSGNTACYVNDILKACKTWFNYLVEEDYIEERRNPAAKVKYLKQPKTIIETFSTQEVKELIHYYSGCDYLEVRNKTIITLLFDTGMRCNEMIMMEPEDIKKDYIVVKHGKGNKERVVPKSPMLSKQLVRYLYVRENYFEGKSTSNDTKKTGWSTGGPGASKSDSSTSKNSASTTTTNSDVIANGNGKDNYGHDKFDAFVIAEKAVKEKLKSPSTAQFCTTTEATIGRNGNIWTVKGWVDAQNGYGATVRANFVVTFTFASKDTYSVALCTVS